MNSCVTHAYARRRVSVFQHTMFRFIHDNNVNTNLNQCNRRVAINVISQQVTGVAMVQNDSKTALNKLKL